MDETRADTTARVRWSVTGLVSCQAESICARVRFASIPDRHTSTSSMVGPDQPVSRLSPRSGKKSRTGTPHSVSPRSTSRAYSAAVIALAHDPMCH